MACDKGYEIGWPIHEVRFRNEPCQLPLMSVIFDLK